MGQKHKNEREKTDWGVLYFSGTGNTRYCVSLLSDSLGRKEIPCPIEKKEAVEVLRSHEALILAYPIQYSNLPDIVRVFIEQNRECWRGKQVFLMATMGLFSGDGTGVAARLLKKYGAVVTGGVHIRMPDSVADVKTLIKPEKENRQIVAAAGEKVRRTAERIKQGKCRGRDLEFFPTCSDCSDSGCIFGMRHKNIKTRLRSIRKNAWAAGSARHVVRGKIFL